MIQPPPLTIEDIPKVADWVELCALLSADNTISRTEAGDALSDLGLLGAPLSESFEEADGESSDIFLSGGDRVEQFTAEVWDEIDQRAREQLAFPFRVSPDSLTRRVPTWKEAVCYTALLLADIGRDYSSVNVGFVSGGPFPTLFERIVEASMRAQFGKDVVHAGAASDGWPTDTVERFELFAERMRLKVSKAHLREELGTYDKDNGVDVAARIPFPQHQDAGIVMLIQCATGNNWRGKKCEPSLTEWYSLMKWKAQLVRTLAVPWRLDPKNSENQGYGRLFIKMDKTVILDRPRLMAPKLEEKMHSESRTKLAAWCDARIINLPTL